MTTSIGIQNQSICAEGDLIYIPEFGVLDASSFDLKGRRYQGRVYKLSQEGARLISEALGFTARFDQGTVRTAYADLNKIDARITFEMSRNTRPNEVGLRYAGDRWTVQDSGRVNDTLRPWLRTDYACRGLPERSLRAIAEIARISLDDLSSTFVRVNFKEQSLSLIFEESKKNKLPAGHFSSFSLPEDSMGLVATAGTAEEETVTNKGKNEMADSRTEGQASTQEGQNASWKYMTYSRSEVDRLIKQQVEALQSNLVQKINNQQKAMQEAISTNSRSLKETVEKASERIENITFDFEKQKDRQSEEALKEMETLKKQFQNELVVFRNDTSKSAQQNLRAIEEHVNSIKQLVADVQKPEVKREPPVLLIVAAVGALTLINTILLFVKH